MKNAKLWRDAAELPDREDDDFRQTPKSSVKSESLKEIIADLIYTADWEITPRPVNGFDSVYMINEDDVVQEIIDVVRKCYNTPFKGVL